jgi:fucose permease
MVPNVMVRSNISRFFIERVFKSKLGTSRVLCFFCISICLCCYTLDNTSLLLYVQARMTLPHPSLHLG